MKKLTEKRLLDLGFEKVNVNPDESGEERAYYYFIYGNYKALSLITDTNDKTENENYYVEFFDYPENGKIYDYDDVKMLIKILESAVK